MTTEFLDRTPSNLFNISASDFNIKSLKKVQYQNHLRKMLLTDKDNEKSSNTDKPIKLIHTDWACKIPHMRLKFLPDFETLKKPEFGLISKFVCFQLQATNRINLLLIQQITYGQTTKLLQRHLTKRSVCIIRLTGSREPWTYVIVAVSLSPIVATFSLWLTESLIDSLVTTISTCFELITTRSSTAKT